MSKKKANWDQFWEELVILELKWADQLGGREDESDNTDDNKQDVVEDRKSDTKE